jgi:GT2 family glycosyltransferase
MTSSPSATAVIVTRDRREALRSLLESLRGQTTRPELVVFDDASSDGSFEMVRSEFPEAVARRFDEPLGCIARRSEAADIARGEILFFLDDDIEIGSQDTLERTLAEFDDPRIGAVAMPYMEAWDAPRVRKRAPSPREVYVTFRYAGGACAVRRDVFRALGGYRPGLVIQGEESDLCLRMIAAGYVTRLGSAAPLLHLRLPPDDLDSKAFNGTRNELLYAWRNVPLPYLGVRMIKLLARAVVVGVGSRNLGAAARGLLEGVRRIIEGAAQRRPVDRDVYRLAHRLKGARPLRLAEIEHDLPPPIPT